MDAPSQRRDVWHMSLGLGVIVLGVLGLGLYGRSRPPHPTPTLGYWHWQGQVSGQAAPGSSVLFPPADVCFLWLANGEIEVLHECTCQGIHREL
jgi:hypothetical protein